MTGGICTCSLPGCSVLSDLHNQILVVFFLCQTSYQFCLGRFAVGGALCSRSVFNFGHSTKVPTAEFPLKYLKYEKRLGHQIEFEGASNRIIIWVRAASTLFACCMLKMVETYFEKYVEDRRNIFAQYASSVCRAIQNYSWFPLKHILCLVIWFTPIWTNANGTTVNVELYHLNAIRSVLQRI